jgi:hypothetical protein
VDIVLALLVTDLRLRNVCLCIDCLLDYYRPGEADLLLQVLVTVCLLQAYIMEPLISSRGLPLNML